MDSPVIVDAASKFGREIDLDCSFPGFPFDDDGSFPSRRSDSIRAHLDDLASRHPELAEHLLGPPWSDQIPFQGSLLRGCRRRRRGSGSSGSQGYQGHVDEDARSQASGSSAASGASAVSSHSGETESIPQYDLRNTVDLGQQQRNMHNTEKNTRSHRSMSAPPENIQQRTEMSQQQSQSPNQNQRFVSRVDITPQHNQQQRTQSPKPSSSPPLPPPPPPPPPSNVRHIPIFVEGRDEPVISKIVEETPPSFQRHPSPPHFHRPSHFNNRFTKQQWPQQHFQSFYEKPTDFEPSIIRHHQQFQQQPPQHFSQHPSRQSPPPAPSSPPPPPPSPPPSQEQQQQEISKPKPSVPKDPLEKVAQVQKDVDDLAEQVRCYVGGSRQDKEYVYLDEMLTRELIKLDDIETEGRENVRQARRNAIKSIQDTISLLEKKAPLAGQQQELQKEQLVDKNHLKAILHTEPMEMDSKLKKQENQIKEVIPLPPAPLLMKTDTSSGNESAERVAEAINQDITPTNQDVEEKNHHIDQQEANKNTEQKINIPLIDELSCTEKTIGEVKSNDDNIAEMMGNETTIAQKQTTEERRMEVSGQQMESPKLQKKVKKTIKQPPPVSEQAIPLPPPPSSSEGAK